MLKGLTKYILVLIMSTSLYQSATVKATNEYILKENENVSLTDKILNIEDKSEMLKSGLEAIITKQSNCLELSLLYPKMIREIERRDAAELEARRLAERIEAERKKLEAERIEAERVEAERIRIAHLRVNYNQNDLTERSNLTQDKAYRMLSGSPLQRLSNTYVRMEEVYGVNSVFLIALTIEESGNGTSSLASSHNNLAGIKNINGEWRYFNSWEESLEHTARLLSKSYLSKSGAYYDGKSIWSVNKKYCVETTWSGNISRIANTYLNKIQ